MTRKNPPSKKSKDRSGQESEIINRCEITPLIITRHYNIFMPLYDQGIDFILHREKDQKTFFVQLKGRFTVDKKYKGRGIHLLFPNTDKSDQNRQWYLVEHDKMIDLAADAGLNIRDSKSWKAKGDKGDDKGKYSIGKLSSRLLEVFAAYKLEDVLQ